MTTTHTKEHSKPSTYYPPDAPAFWRNKTTNEPWWRFILTTYTTRFLRESCYTLTAGALGFGTFVLLPIGFSIGAGLAITLIGIPVLLITMYLWRGATWLIGWHNWLYTLKTPAQPKYRATPREAGIWRRVKTDVTDPQTWVSFGAVLAHILTSFAAWVGTIVVWTMLLAPVTVGVGYRGGNPELDQAEISFFDRTYQADDPQYLAVAGAFSAVVFLLGPWLVRALAHVHYLMNDFCTHAFNRSRKEVAHVKKTRAKARASQSEALRRLERNIHDGPQQQLVRVGMDLHRAHKNVTTDPEKTTQILTETIVRVDQTLLELRDLSRGIAPPVLADRGLGAAVNELASRSDIRTTVDCHLTGELPYYTEETAYFVISEALANANKHSAATKVQITLTATESAPELVVTVHDDGAGGASASKGHGLAGLTQRVEAADGTLDITSPNGGPTTLKAVIPCAW